MCSGSGPVQLPRSCGAFVEMQSTDRLSTDELREFAKTLNRIWANIVPAIYDDADATALIKRTAGRHVPRHSRE